MRRAPIVLALLLLACGEGGPVAVEKPERQRAVPEAPPAPHLYVQVAAELENAEVALGEAVVVRRVFENVGPRPGVHTRSFGRDIYLAVVIRAGRAARLYDAKWLEAPVLDVEPGERVEGRMLVELSQPGTYEIEVPPAYVSRGGLGEVRRLPVRVVDRGDPRPLEAKAERLGGRIAVEDPECPTCWTEAQQDLSDLGAAAVPHLRRWLRASESAYLRAVAAKLLARVDGREGIGELVAGLADGHADVRNACLRSLGAFRDPATLDAILRTTADEDPWVRAEAYETLAAFDDPRVVPALREGLADADDFARLWAAMHLADEKRDAAGIHVLIGALSGDGLGVSLAARALETLTGESFGEPGHPGLASGFAQMEDEKRRLEEVVAKWLAWWEETGRARYDPR